jgi:ubiquinone/menaquinone biosynthesis C-methylase UbiE
MGVFKKWYRQRGKPEGVFGRIAAGAMNRSSAKLSDWGIAHLGEISPRVIADLGCGGGRNAKVLLEKYPDAKLLGLDHSETAVRVANTVNKTAVLEKRCRILQGDVRAIPFRDGIADLVTAFDTVCFWKEPEKGLKEAGRILNSGGIFLIASSNDGIPNQDGILSGEETAGLKKEELCALLKEAGFSDIGVDHDSERHMLCIICRR